MSGDTPTNTPTAAGDFACPRCGLVHFGPCQSWAPQPYQPYQLFDSTHQTRIEQKLDRIIELLEQLRDQRNL